MATPGRTFIYVYLRDGRGPGFVHATPPWGLWNPDDPHCLYVPDEDGEPTVWAMGKIDNHQRPHTFTVEG